MNIAAWRNSVMNNAPATTATVAVSRTQLPLVKQPPQQRDEDGFIVDDDSSSEGSRTELDSICWTGQSAPRHRALPEFAPRHDQHRDKEMAQQRRRKGQASIDFRPPFLRTHATDARVAIRNTLKSEPLEWTKPPRSVVTASAFHFDGDAMGSSSFQMHQRALREGDASRQQQQQHQRAVPPQSATTRAAGSSSASGSTALVVGASKRLAAGLPRPQTQQQQQNRPAMRPAVVPSSASLHLGAASALPPVGLQRQTPRELMRHPQGRPETHPFANSFFEFFGKCDKYNQPSGYGALFLRNGTRLEGTFVAGELTCAKGKRSNADGSVYEGAFVEGQYHGEGTLLAPGGYRYEGQWREGRPFGLGLLIDHRRGIAFRGQFDSTFHGRGSMEKFEQHSTEEEESEGKNRALPTVLFTISGNFERGVLHGPAEIDYKNGDTVRATFVRGVTSRGASEFRVTGSSIVYNDEMHEQRVADASTGVATATAYPENALQRRWVQQRLALVDVQVDGCASVPWNHPGRLSLVRARLDERAAVEKRLLDAAKKQEQLDQQRQQPASPALRSPSGGNVRSPSSPSLALPQQPALSSARSSARDGSNSNRLASVSYLDLLEFAWLGSSDDFVAPAKKPADGDADAYLAFVLKNVPPSRKAKPPADVAAAVKKAATAAAPPPAPASPSVAKRTPQQQQQSSQPEPERLALPLESRAVWIAPHSRVSLSLHMVCPDEAQREAQMQLLALQQQQQQQQSKQRHIDSPVSTARTHAPPAAAVAADFAACSVSDRVVVENGRDFELRVYALPPLDSPLWADVLDACANDALAQIAAADAEKQQQQQQRGSCEEDADAGDKFLGAVRAKEARLAAIIDAVTNAVPVDLLGPPEELLDLRPGGPAADSAIRPFEPNADAAAVAETVRRFVDEQSRRGGGSARRAVAAPAAPAGTPRSALASSRRPDSASRRVTFSQHGAANVGSESPSPASSSSSWNVSRFPVKTSIVRTAKDGVLDFDFIVLAAGAAPDPQRQFLVDIQAVDDRVQVVAGDADSAVAVPLSHRFRIRHVVPRKGVIEQEQQQQMKQDE